MEDQVETRESEVADGNETLTALDVARYFIWKDFYGDKTLSHLKLQKLLYFSQGLFLAVTDQPLFSDTIYAWKYGPVIDSVYHVFKVYGSQPINKYNMDINKPTLNPFQKEFLEFIWVKYSSYDALFLSELTHVGDSPWSKIIKEKVGSLENLTDYIEIPLEYLKSYFITQLKSSK